MKKIVLGIIVIVFSLTLLACNNQDDNGMIPDPGGKFSYDMVIVTLTVSATDAARISEHEFTPADFPVVRLSEVRELGGPFGSNPLPPRWLVLILENPGRSNVLRAVYAINKGNGVHSASLSFIAHDGI